MKNYKIELEVIRNGIAVKVQVVDKGADFPYQKIGRFTEIDLSERVNGALKTKDVLKAEIFAARDKIVAEYERLETSEKFVKSLEAELNQ